MSSSIGSDQRCLITVEHDNPPTYQDVTNQSYGTFINSSTTSYALPYPCGIGSQQTTVIILGGCPVCKIGMLDTEFTCFGLCCALFFFPIGILCCLALRQRRCNFCGAVID